MDIMEQVQQSRRDFVLAGAFEVGVTVVEGVQGKGRKKCPFSLSEKVKEREEWVKWHVERGYVECNLDCETTAQDALWALHRMVPSPVRLSVEEYVKVLRVNPEKNLSLTWREVVDRWTKEGYQHPFLKLRTSSGGKFETLWMTREYEDSWVLLLTVLQGRERLMILNKPCVVLKPDSYDQYRFCARCRCAIKKRGFDDHACLSSGRRQKRSRQRFSFAEMDPVVVKKRKKRSLKDIDVLANCFGVGVFEALQLLGEGKDGEMLESFEEYYVKAGIEKDQACGFPEFLKMQECLNAVHPGTILNVYDQEKRCIVFSGNSGWHSKRRKHHLYLNLYQQHYDVIVSMPGWLGRVYFCEECRKGYNDKKQHKCTKPCSQCKTFPSHRPGPTGSVRYCHSCCRKFWNQECYDKHLASTCFQFYWCKQCEKTVNRFVGGSHVCHQYKCSNCKQYAIRGEHLCYMQPWTPSLTRIEEKVESEEEEEVEEEKEDEEESGIYEKFNYCFFDFETQPLEEYHVVNMAIAIRACEMCYTQPAEIPCVGKCGRQRIFKFSTLDDFCRWMCYDEENDGYLFIAHNFKGFDSYPILEWCFKNNCAPKKALMQGGKVLTVRVGSRVFKDSLNFIPIALRMFPKAFGLQECEKGWFPHFFNTSANANYRGVYPDAEFYGVEEMRSGEAQALRAWLAERRAREEVFDLQKELERYCLQDVKVLMNGCLKFRTMIFEQYGVECFTEFITLASMCLGIFRKNYLKPQTVGVIPSTGYRGSDVQSYEALEWLESLEVKGLRTAMSAQGEYKVGGLKVDGYDPKTKTVYQYHGCYWHGCPSCYGGSGTVNRVNGKSMADLYESTLRRTREIQNRGYRLVEKWGHEWKKERDDKQYVPSRMLQSKIPLYPRKALCGGRVEVFRMYANALDLPYEEVKNWTNEEWALRIASTDWSKSPRRIRYFDVTSLYPYSQKAHPYPIDHPEIICGEDARLHNVRTVTDKILEESYFGLVKCEVDPPRRLWIPLLPQIARGRLMFSLCSACAEEVDEKEEEEEEGVCSHTELERRMIGVWTTPELKRALELGYRLHSVHEIWQYHSQSLELFQDYVKDGLKGKMQASGWPCVGEQERQAYLDEVYAKEGVRLDPEKIVKNPSMRFINKLMLNSLWGKFAQNPCKTKTKFVSEPEEYFRLIEDDTYEVTYVTILTDDLVQVQYREEKEALPESFNINVVIAAFVTAYARLQLFSYLNFLGDRVIYCDTDSVIFETSSEEQEDLALGNALGELTDETEGGPENNWLVEFVAMGPKSDAYREKNGKQVVKCKGVTLTPQALEEINLDRMTEMVVGESVQEFNVAYPHKIHRDVQTRRLRTERQEKRLLFNYVKRRIDKNRVHTRPHGY